MQTLNLPLFRFFAPAALIIVIAATLHTCTPAAATVSDGQADTEQTYPADWTQNPTAAVVYEPTDERGEP